MMMYNSSPLVMYVWPFRITLSKGQDRSQLQTNKTFMRLTRLSIYIVFGFSSIRSDSVRISFERTWRQHFETF